jgi:hypothetical protein
MSSWFDQQKKKFERGVGSIVRAPEVIGKFLGNQISRSQRAENIVNTVGRYGGEQTARAVRDLTGVTDFMKSGKAISEGRYKDATGRALLGVANLALSASALGPGYNAARAGGRSVLPSLVRGATGKVAPRAGAPLQNALRVDPTRRVMQSISSTKLGSRIPLIGNSKVQTLAQIVSPGSIGARVAKPYVDPYIDRGAQATVDYLERRFGGGPPPQGPSTLGMTADMMERRLAGGAPVSTAPRSTGPQGSQFVDPTTGFVNTWNPLRQAYEVTGLRPSGNRAGSSTPATTEEVVTGGPMGALPMLPEEGYVDGGLQEYLDAGLGTAAAGGYAGGGMGGGGAGYSSELAALDPDQMEELLQAARDEERRYQEVLNQIGRTTSEKERAFFDLQRGVGREVAGGRQTTSSALAQLGLDTSPAPAAYSEYLGATGQRRIAQGRADLAEILADLRQQRGTAEARKLAALREIDKATRRARVQNTMRQAGNYF